MTITVTIMPEPEEVKLSGGKCVTCSRLTNSTEGKLLKPITIMVSKLTGGH